MGCHPCDRQGSGGKMERHGHIFSLGKRWAQIKWRSIAPSALCVPGGPPRARKECEASLCKCGLSLEGIVSDAEERRLPQQVILGFRG